MRGGSVAQSGLPWYDRAAATIAARAVAVGAAPALLTISYTVPANKRARIALLSLNWYCLTAPATPGEVFGVVNITPAGGAITSPLVSYKRIAAIGDVLALHLPVPYDLAPGDKLDLTLNFSALVGGTHNTHVAYSGSEYSA